MNKQAVLRQYFGHKEFRTGQEELIDAVLAGQDVLGVMPTGAGKSMCYQIPALLLPGITLVISPLISLMKDQVAALSQAGIPAAFINSSLSATQHRQVFRRAGEGQYKIIYVAPERLTTEAFLRFSEETEISFVAVDEAHCVSQWGQDFRPSYLRIVEYVESLSKRPVVGAFTATATAQVKVDIVRMLRLNAPLLLTTGFDRPNLFFKVIKPQNKLLCVRDYIFEHRDKAGIIYCATRKAVDAVCSALCKLGVSAAGYHAGLPDEERRQNQEDFVYDRKQVMVATNAFGMGIDKSNISFVLHYNMPKNIESYYQEAGRAGRDGEPADCILLFSPSDIVTAKFLIQVSNENEELAEEEQKIVQARDMERLEQMIGYCKTHGCLRAYILSYFGDTHGGNCGTCGNCKGSFVTKDITTEAQKILSCVARIISRHPYGLGQALIVQVLHGSREQRLLQLHLDTLPTYGILSNINKLTIREYIDCLVAQGYLEVSEGEYPVLRLTDRAGDVLLRGKKVEFLQNTENFTGNSRPQKRKTAALAPADEGLLATLKALRTTLATEARVPSYIIFSNATLTDMAAKAPSDMEELLQVSGVGQVKADRYGAQFLACIKENA